MEGIAVPYRLKTLTLLGALLLPGIAHAHAILEESTPPAGASVKAGPLDLQLRYNSRIDRERSRLTLIRPDQAPDQAKQTIPIDAEGPPDILAAHLTLSPGAYIVRWQVLAVDGHITRGDVPITVTAP
jgi:copper resistance protein C